MDLDPRPHGMGLHRTFGDLTQADLTKARAFHAREGAPSFPLSNLKMGEPRQMVLATNATISLMIVEAA